MKKLSIICAVVLALGMTVPQVFAQSFGIDYGADGKPPFDVNVPPTGILAPLGSVDIDVWLTNVPEPMIGVGFVCGFNAADLSVAVTVFDNGVGGPGYGGGYSSLPGLQPTDWDPTTTSVAAYGPGFFVALGDVIAVSPDGDGDIPIARLTVTDLTGVGGTISLNISAAGPFPLNATPTVIIDSSIPASPIDIDVLCICTDDSDCDDGDWCTGTATCESCECIPGTPPCVDTACTTEVCDGVAETCAPATCDGVAGPSDPCCDDPACADESACGGVGITVQPGYYYGDVGIKVDICLDNEAFEVGGIQLEICDQPNCLECVGCELTERTVQFDCHINDVDGCCNVLLFSKHPGGIINPGLCNIIKLDYKKCDPQNDPLCAAPEDCEGCVELALTEDSIASDPYVRPLDISGTAGSICPFACGDVHPSVDDDSCGDGDVDLMDIMTEVDLALGNPATTCQLGRGDVPTGTPGRVPAGCDDDKDGCCPPDGTINILDVMVLIDSALNRQDCCTYYYTGIIY